MAALWRFYTRVGLPVLGRAVSREWAHTGRFLSESIPAFYERYPMARIVELWEQAGIVDVRVRRMSLGGGVVMWGTKQSRSLPRREARRSAVTAASSTVEGDPAAAAAGKANAGGDTEPT